VSEALRPLPQTPLKDETPYTVEAFAGPVDLHLEGNEGSLPPPDWVAALAPYGPDLVRRYPSHSALDELLADEFAVPREGVLLTAGADDALDRVFRAMVGPGQEVLLTTPTFEMIERFARLAGGRLVEVPWVEGPYPLASVLSKITSDTAVIAVVTPNNPTGLVVAADTLRQLSLAAPHATLLVDMAYGEFAAADIAKEVLGLPNAVMVRTFSKAWGFAGLRVGYAVGPLPIVAAMRLAGPPYPLAGPSVAMVTNRYLYERESVAGTIAQVKKERAALMEQLERLGAKPWSSEGNFVLARFAAPVWVWQGLGGLGIAVRRFGSRPHLEDCLRLTCPGEAGRFERLRSGLNAVLAPQALLFDMDGVLADVSESYRTAIVETGAAWNVTITSTDIAAAKARGGANNDWELTQRLMVQRGVSVSVADVTERFERLYQGTQERPGLWTRERLLWPREALRALSVRIPLGIVTGRPRHDAQRFLREHQVEDLFRVVVCMEDGPLKPDPAPVRKALSQLGVEAAWLIGDTPDDLVAARRAGVVPLAVIAPQDDVETQKQVMLRAGAARMLSGAHDLEALLP
jgi:histidinol-phosphate aminotransferase